MELFAAAGIDLPSQGRGQPAARRPAPRSLRAPLFAWKALNASLGKSAFAPDPAQEKTARDYARKVRRLKGEKETAFRPVFIDDVLVKLLGYRRLDPEARYTLAYEERLGHGNVDTALGHFDPDGSRKVLAPFELKGPDTADLDRIMPGRGKTPVQQAWDYANDAPGAKWVLVSNCREIRLYGYGRGREAYEVFDLARLDEPDEHRRLWHVLSADRFLGGATDALLRETDEAYRAITDDLYASYKGLRDRLIEFLVHSADGPKLRLGAAIEPAQKILDRILFIAFAQRNELMRDGLLEQAAKLRNDFDPQPLWRNFLGLFRMVDRGHFDLDVPPYNGGLFAPDPALDALVLPDALAKDIASLGQWDYRDEAPVGVLGHIFEKSVTDIDRLRAEARGEAAPKVAKTKKEGVVYTKSDAVIRFIIEATLGRVLQDRRAALAAAHGLAPGGALGEDAERAFLSAWLDALMATSVVDPACGSGAFLVAALDRLALEYRPVVARLTELGADPKLDVFDTILTRNLYGVDLNAESVEITRLSLWLKTARRERPLQSLDANVVAGDSIVADGAFTPRPFDWRARFPQVFDKGGFDAVIGNPPYVRMEFIKPFKPWLAENYVVAADRTDLYAYFFERGVGLLRAQGRLGFITSSTYFRTGSGEKLRGFLTDGVQIESVVDFGDLQLFDDVTTYTAILTLKKGGDGHDGDLAFLKVEDDVPDDLTAAFAKQATAMPRARLGAGSWQFEDAPLAALRDKIVRGRKTLGEVYGPPLRGIVTGLNEAFVVDRATHDRLIAADPKSAELLKPFLRGENVRRWRVESEDLWLINTPKGKVDIDAYPAIRKWLLPFRPALEARATKQEWWELQQAQLAYQAKFHGKKIVWAHFQIERLFSIDDSGSFLNNKCFFLDRTDTELLAILNSQLAWSELRSIARIKRGGYIEMEAQYVERLPIPDMSPAARARLAALGETCTQAARRRWEIVCATRHRLLDLAPPGRRKLTRRLEEFHTLDFAAFRAEVKKAFRAEIPLKQRGEWETYLTGQSVEVRRLTAEIEAAERAIDAEVYALFDLTADEIALLESSLEGQY
jgi:hypothetical protein